MKLNHHTSLNIHLHLAITLTFIAASLFGISCSQELSEIDSIQLQAPTSALSNPDVPPPKPNGTDEPPANGKRPPVNNRPSDNRSHAFTPDQLPLNFQAFSKGNLSPDQLETAFMNSSKDPTSRRQLPIEKGSLMSASKTNDCFLRISICNNSAMTGTDCHKCNLFHIVNAAIGTTAENFSF